MTAPPTQQPSPTTDAALYLGPPNSFSHAAALEFLSSQSSDWSSTAVVPKPSFDAIFSALQNEPGTYSCAVLPVENSTNGAVVQVLDLLARCGTASTTTTADAGAAAPQKDDNSNAAEKETYPDLYVTNEHYLTVSHSLYIHRDALLPSNTNTPLQHRPIKAVYTHPQVWTQCTRYLSSALPPGEVRRVDKSSTSAAAAFVAAHGGQAADDEREGGSEGTIAAIASPLAGTAHPELVCVREKIEDVVGGNTTRFLVLRNRKEGGKERQRGTITPPASEGTAMLKSLLTFTIPHRTPGSLALALAVFGECGFNLTNIQSRPSGVESWHYVFFVECLHEVEEHGEERGATDRLLKELRERTVSVKLLGSWRDRLGAE